MDSFGQKVPEIKYSSDANEIPWEDAVVWTSMPRVGPRVYEWLESSHIRYVSWTNGIVNIMPENDSILSDKCQCMVLPSAFVWVGKNVKVA
ncbi:MAG: hypothetical protein A2X35_03885 [Elusimicrobia bacterium GWA2_61_42]|nr:MAG: hypothetical protein A2X35_03885 [Elusimicrobia bacterium GWA2_61_42]OGR77717.1 MAG: hypothetical protein A2X38_10125 [Elusimicrobia bacterium GWC2_61_25]